MKNSRTIFGGTFYSCFWLTSADIISFTGTCRFDIYIPRALFWNTQLTRKMMWNITVFICSMQEWSAWLSCSVFTSYSPNIQSKWRSGFYQQSSTWWSICMFPNIHPTVYWCAILSVYVSIYLSARVPRQSSLCVLTHRCSILLSSYRPPPFIIRYYFHSLNYVKYDSDYLYGIFIHPSRVLFFSDYYYYGTLQHNTPIPVVCTIPVFYLTAWWPEFWFLVNYIKINKAKLSFDIFGFGWDART